MHHDELDRSEWDRPRRADPPSRRLVICSTARSGSYLLCRQMINAGLGLPTEYFRERTVGRLRARWGLAPGDDDAYIDELEARRTTDNGVFAAKIQGPQFAAHPRVRERLHAWEQVMILTGTFGRSEPSLDALQLPHVPQDKWIGLDLPAGEKLVEDIFGS